MTVTPITTGSFDGRAFPHDLAAEILNEGLGGAPVFGAMTRRVTSRGSLVFATGDPSGFGWTAELAAIPEVDPGDDSAIVSVMKLAGLLTISNEALGDSQLNLTAELSRLVSESMAHKADVDLTYGLTPAPTPPAIGPTGFYSGLTAADGPNLRASVLAAATALLTAGGQPDTVILSPALWSAEMARRETTPAGTGPLFEDLGLALKVIVAPTLQATDGLVLDSSGCFAVVRDDFSIESSTTAGSAWTNDGLSLRIKARLAVAIPQAAKSARKLTVTPEPETP